MKNRSIPKSNPKFGKAKEPKPSKPPVARRVNLGRDARSGESLETGRADVIAARVGLTRRDAATSANETPEATNSPTTTVSATTASVGETDATVETTSKKGRKAAKAPKPTKVPKPAKQAKERKPKRVSALDAAALILADTGKAMRATELIAEMERRGLWKSPGGKTPESTLYAALAREIAFKGDASRFARGEKGFFIARTPS
ncbi:MAG: HTH domain-containing protein [Phycisphaerales bacterium]